MNAARRDAFPRVPTSHGAEVDAVVSRARAILTYRSPEQLRRLADVVDKALLPGKQGQSAPSYAVIGGGRVHALRQSLALATEPEVENVKPCDLFALLALQLVGCASFMEALEALCYAESLVRAARQDARYKLMADAYRVTTDYHPTLLRASEERVVTEVAKRSQRRAQDISKISHETHAKWKADAETLYRTNKDSMQSMANVEEAAEAILKMPEFALLAKGPGLSTVIGYLRPIRQELGHARVGRPAGQPRRKK